MKSQSSISHIEWDLIARRGRCDQIVSLWGHLHSTWWAWQQLPELKCVLVFSTWWLSHSKSLFYWLNIKLPLSGKDVTICYSMTRTSQMRSCFHKTIFFAFFVCLRESCYRKCSFGAKYSAESLETRAVCRSVGKSLPVYSSCGGIEAISWKSNQPGHYLHTATLHIFKIKQRSKWPLLAVWSNDACKTITGWIFCQKFVVYCVSQI